MGGTITDKGAHARIPAAGHGEHHVRLHPGARRQPRLRARARHRRQAGAGRDGFNLGVGLAEPCCLASKLLCTGSNGAGGSPAVQARRRSRRRGSTLGVSAWRPGVCLHVSTAAVSTSTGDIGSRRIRSVARRKARCRSGRACAGCSGRGGRGQSSAVMALVLDKWGWAIGTGLMALVSYLLTPVESAAALRPRSPVGDRRRGVPGHDRRRHRGAASRRATASSILNNGDEFYPAMLDAIARAQASITIEAYIYWAGEIGLVVRARARGARTGGRPREDPARRGRLGHASATRSWRCSKPAAASSRGTTRCAGTRIGRFNHRTHRKSLIVDGRIGFTGGAGIADHWQGHARGRQTTGATCRSASRARP